MNANELASLRAEVEELKLQRQELRTLNAFRENEATKWQKEAKAMEERLVKLGKAKEADSRRFQEESRNAQAKIEQLTRTVESVRDKEAGLLEDRRKMSQEVAALKSELQKAKNELEHTSDALEKSERRRLELEEKWEQSDASWRIDRFLVIGEVSEVKDLREKLRVSEEKVKNCQKKVQGLEERLKGEEEKVKQCQKTINELRRTRQEVRVFPQTRVVVEPNVLPHQ